MKVARRQQVAACKSAYLPVAKGIRSVFVQASVDWLNGLGAMLRKSAVIYMQLKAQDDFTNQAAC
jgi:hypothetical protein